MKWTPMIFSEESVLKMLSDRKTQTRRVVKLAEFGRSTTPGFDWEFRNRRACWESWRHDDLIARVCPYGKPGDRIWVRESTFADWRDEGVRIYSATPEFGVYQGNGGVVRSTSPDGSLPTREECRQAMLPKFWSRKSAMFMPRWACRLFLELTEVRVEQVQDISSDDVLAEGSGHPIGTNLVYGYVTEMWNRRVFEIRWDGLNSKRGFPWSSNPWVWALTFRVLEGPAQ